jgi:hypothetical protein
MIARYVGSRSPAGLEPGHRYVVLAVSSERTDAGEMRSFLLHHPDDDLRRDWSWVAGELFQVVSTRIPGNWVFAKNPHGFDFMPAAWRRAGHWDDLAPGETDARPDDVRVAATRRAWADYRSERDRILAEAGMPPGSERLPEPSYRRRPAAA